MSATIEILGDEYIIDAGHWSGSDAGILAFLRALTKEIGDSPSIPDRDEAVILAAEQQISATIIAHSDRVIVDEEKIY